MANTIILFGISSAVQAFDSFVASAKTERPELGVYTFTKLTDEQLNDSSADEEALGSSLLEAMGMLSEESSKLFLFLIDPTAETVNYNRKIRETGKDGNMTMSRKVSRRINQTTMFKQLVAHLSASENAPLLKHVDRLCFITLKSDSLGEERRRDFEALRRFRFQYHGIINPVIKICRDNSINASTEGLPMLFTFSLGYSHEDSYTAADVSKLTEILKGNVACENF